MTAKKQEDQLGEMALALRHSLNESSLVRAARSGSLTRAERHTQVEYRNQLQAIEMDFQKAVAGQTAINAMHVSAYLQARDMTERISTVHASCTLPREFQELLDVYALGTAKQGIGYINLATREGAERILEEIARSVYFPTEEDRQGVMTRFREWLLGSG